MNENLEEKIKITKLEMIRNKSNGGYFYNGTANIDGKEYGFELKLNQNIFAEDDGSVSFLYFCGDEYTNFKGFPLKNEDSIRMKNGGCAIVQVELTRKIYNHFKECYENQESGI